MVKDIWDALKDNLNNKIKNPFLGTFTILFLIENWKLIYHIVFIFDLSSSGDRINLLSNHINTALNLYSLFIVSLKSIGLVLVTNSMQSVSHLITLGFKKYVNVFIEKLTDKNSVVSKIDYDKEKEKNLNYLIEIEEITNRLNKYKKENDELKDKLNQSTTLANSGVYEDPLPNKFDRFYNFLFDNRLLNDYDKLELGIKKKEFIKGKIDSRVIDEAVKRDFIQPIMQKYIGGTEKESGKYEFTEEGKIFNVFFDSHYQR